MAGGGERRYTVGMNALESTYVGAWCVNLALACVFNLRELGHAMGEFLVFAAVFFLLAAPVHGMLLLYAWSRHRAENDARAEPGAAYRAAAGAVCAESLLFWTAYWGMVLGFVPLQIRL